MRHVQILEPMTKNQKTFQLMFSIAFLGNSANFNLAESHLCVVGFIIYLEHIT
jgi:hypothetical protein